MRSIETYWAIILLSGDYGSLYGNNREYRIIVVIGDITGYSTHYWYISRIMGNITLYCSI